MNYILCVVTDVLAFEKRFLLNEAFLPIEIKCIPLLLKGEETPGLLYNRFLESLPGDAEWIAFTTDKVELVKNPFEQLRQSFVSRINGLFGASVVHNNDGDPVIECQGRITAPLGGRQFVYCGSAIENVELCRLDTVDSRFMIIHGSKVREHEIRFNTKMRYLYGEDLCIRALDHFDMIPSVCGADAILHEELFYSLEKLRHDSLICVQTSNPPRPKATTHAILGQDFQPAKRIVLISNVTRESSKIYARTVNPQDMNLPIVLAERMLPSQARLLDVGCSTGDNGLFLSTKLDCDLYGFEYDNQSLELARSKNVYKSLHLIDVNQLQPHFLSQYYGFFDAVLLLDVLEHLFEPMQALSRLSFFLKPSGVFIISIPNIAHAFPVLGLINQEFSYQEYGILDSTHVRFFTWKSLAKSLAAGGFVVDSSMATFRSPNTPNTNAPTVVPQHISKTLLENPHSLVCQYVCRVRQSAESYAELKAKNLAALSVAPNANPKGMELIAADFQKFKRKMDLGIGDVHSSREVKMIKMLVKNGQYIEAIALSGFFDEQWYRETNDDVDYTNLHPLEHYLLYGWKEGRNPSEAFDQQWYQKQIGELGQQADVCPLLLHLGYTLGKIAHNPRCLEPDTLDLANFAEFVISADKKNNFTFEQVDSTPLNTDPADPKIVAFYLPQFSPFPENDRWWGKGFTEWTNVTKAQPLFAGHYQPHLPYDLGFYDLRVKETCLRQEELARDFGLYGFCYHYYWFDGTKLMNAPIEKKLTDPELRLPFCLSWANEAWSSNWDGSHNNLLIDQPKTIDAHKLFRDLLPFFEDARYICVDGNPFFMIYRPTYFSQKTVKKFISEMRSLAIENGLPGLHVALGTTMPASHPLERLDAYGADSYVEFPPHRFTHEPTHPGRLCSKCSNATFYDLPTSILHYQQCNPEHAHTYRTVFPSWDNTSRKAETGATVFLNASPDVYMKWLTWCLDKAAVESQGRGGAMVFVNAWNEWAEGAHLEPDRKYGYAFLNRTKMAVLAARKARKQFGPSGFSVGS